MSDYFIVPVPIFELIQALMLVIVTCNMKKVQSKSVEKKGQLRFPHYKSMGIFSDAQGHLTPLSVVRSGRNSNASGFLCMFSLPARK